VDLVSVVDKATHDAWPDEAASAQYRNAHLEPPSFQVAAL